MIAKDGKIIKYMEAEGVEPSLSGFRIPTVRPPPPFM